MTNTLPSLMVAVACSGHRQASARDAGAATARWRAKDVLAEPYRTLLLRTQPASNHNLRAPVPRGR